MILSLYIIYISQISNFHTLGRLGIPGVTLQHLLTSPLSRYNWRNVWIDIPHTSVASWFGIS